MIRSVWKAAFMLLCCALVAVPPCCADGSLEYQVKAVCILNAARFVEWPASAFESPTSPIVIGILGENPFDSVLDKAVAHETANHRQIVVRQLGHGDPGNGCHILFISRSETGRLSAILQFVGNTSVLTVSEIDHFAERGGIIGLAMQDNNVRFEVNPRAAQQARLNISSKLLGLAKIVK